MNIKNNHYFRLKSLLDKYTQYCLLLLGAAAYSCSCQAATSTASASFFGPGNIALNNTVDSIIISDKDNSTPSNPVYRFIRCSLSPTKDINECSIVHTYSNTNHLAVLTLGNYEVNAVNKINERKYVYEVCNSERRCSTIETAVNTQPDYSIDVGNNQVLTFTGNKFKRLTISPATTAGGNPTAQVSADISISGVDVNNFGTIKAAAYNAENNHLRLFVTHDARMTLYSCSMDASGITCNHTLKTSTDINSMAYNPSGEFLFYTTNSGVKRCPANFTSFSQCVDAISNSGDRSTIDTPYGITFNDTGNDAYVSSARAQKIFHCSVSGSGSLDGCYEAKQTIKTTVLRSGLATVTNSRSGSYRPGDNFSLHFQNISGATVNVRAAFVGSNTAQNWIHDANAGSLIPMCASSAGSQTTLAKNGVCRLDIQVPSTTQNGEFVVSIVSSGQGTSSINRLNFFKVHISDEQISISNGNSPGEDVGNILHLVNGQQGQISVTSGHPSARLPVGISKSLSSRFTGNCSDKNSALAKTGHCTLNFNVNNPPGTKVHGQLTLHALHDNRAVVFALPVFISDLNVGFSLNTDAGFSGTTQVVDVLSGEQGTLTIRNNGEALHNFRLRVANRYTSWFTSSDCPLTSAENFAGGQTCTLNYNIPRDAPTVTASILPYVDSARIFGGLLSVRVSSFHISSTPSDGTALRSLNLVRSQAGRFRLFTGQAVSGYSLRFTDASGNTSSQLTRFFSGGCLTATSLSAQSSCNLNFHIDVGDEFTGLSGFLKINGNGLNDVFVLPVNISPNLDLGFSSDGTQKFANIIAGDSGNLTIYNNGHDINSLRFVLPAGNVGFDLNNVDCPVGTGRVFRHGDHCTLEYSAGSSLRNGTFRVIPALGFNPLENQALRINVSELDVSEEFHSTDGHPDLQNIDHLSLYKNMNGHLNLKTKHPIEDMSISFSDPALADHFYGNCMNISSLAAKGTCSLNYTVDSDATIDRVISGRMLVHRGHGENQQTIFSLPVTLHPITAVSVTTESLYRYNSGIITVHNNSARRFYNFRATYDTPLFKLIADGCTSTIDPGADCTIKLIPLGGKSVQHMTLSVYADSLLRQDIQLPIGNVPVRSLQIENRGGYILRAYYPQLNSDGSISVGATGDFTSPKNKTVNVAYFNDLNDLPSYILPNDDEKRIRLKPVGFVHSRYLSLPSCSTAIARCSRSTSNPNCYYRQGC